MTKIVQNEQVKLLAALFNTCAAGVFTAWVVAPGAAFLYTGVQTGSMRPFLLGVPIGLGGAFMLHVAARIVLSRLRE